MKMFMLSAEKFNILRNKNCNQNLDWKLTSASRKRCHTCSDRLKTPYQCTKCGNGTCCDHSILLCTDCKQ